MKYLLLALLLSAMPKTWAACTVDVDVTGTIGPATVDLVNRVEGFAQKHDCASILLSINTPGGSLDSTRRIVETILNSKRSYLCLVAPRGGHAGSAGAIILQACHVNGALAGTNLGAATPIAAGGQEMPKDLRQKIMNDTRSWLESLTRLRGRSDKFGQDIILEAKAVTAEDALKLKAIDHVGQTKEDFLEFAKTKKIDVGDSKIFEHDTRFKTLALLTDPELAYMIMLGSMALIYFEITHPGTMVAGVVGGVGLVVALVALHKLDVEWGGLALIFLGIAMLIAEMFLPSFGILGAGGIASFVLGSIFLFDPVKTYGYRLPLSLILPMVIFIALIFIGVSWMMLKSRKVKKKGGYDELIGASAPVVKVEDDLIGMLEIQGELWKFRARGPVTIGDRVRITSYEGLVLTVEKES